MTLGRQVVYLIRFNSLNDVNNAQGIGHVAMMEKKPSFGIVSVTVQMIESIRIEKRRAPLESVDHISFIEKEFCEVSSILSGNSGDQGYFSALCFQPIKR
jgi:hypothetical protein